MNKSEHIDIACSDLVLEFPFSASAGRRGGVKFYDASELKMAFRVLDGLTFSIKHGERVGLIGKNGAGKTTLLRMLAGVYAPTSGILIVNTPLASLNDVALGTDIDATGYDNIPLLMATRGIPKSKLAEVTADVEEFTELGEALYRPLRTYSAGMSLRIAFAVATFEVKGLLLLDEVIGVGDQSFQSKSQERILNVIQGAPSLVLASHSDALLKAHCLRGIVLDRGRIVFDGPIEEAIAFKG